MFNGTGSRYYLPWATVKQHLPVCGSEKFVIVGIWLKGGDRHQIELRYITIQSCYRGRR